MAGRTTLKDKEGKEVRVAVETVQSGDEVCEQVKKIAQKSTSLLTKRSIEFINGKRKIRMKDVSKNYRKRLLLQALVHSKGVVMRACQAVGLSYSTFNRYVHNDPDFANAVEQIQEVALDYVEGKMFDNIERGCVPTIIFYMKTKGARRGYSERPELEQKRNPLENFTDKEIDEQIAELSEAIRIAERTETSPTRE